MIGLGLSLTGQRTSASLASLLFGMNEPGFTFEPWDITTLYQDRAGTTPVTAAGQSVGLRRDKSGSGNHQVAVSDAKRGVYGWMPKTGKRNLLTYTEQFDNAAWSKINVSVSSDVVSSPIGSPTTDKLIASVANAQHRIEQNTSVIAGNTYTLSVYAKAGECSGIQMRCAGDVAQTFFDLTAGTIIEIVNGQASISSAGNGWYLCSVKGVAVTTGSAVNRLNILLSGNTNSWTGDGTSGIFIWGAQLEISSIATAYQRVVSQYDITEAGVPTCYYVQADGVDDAYVTPTITPNTDKVQVFAGVRKLSDAADGVVIQFGNPGSLNNGSLRIDAPGSGTVAKYQLVSRGTTTVVPFTASATFNAPVTNVVAGLGDISGDAATLRVNGAQVSQSTADQGAGNYLAYPAYLYARDGTTQPFNGLDFGHAVRFGPNLDAATIARVESLIARNTPEVTL